MSDTVAFQKTLATALFEKINAEGIRMTRKEFDSRIIVSVVGDASTKPARALPLGDTTMNGGLDAFSTPPPRLNRPA
jgi:hypothetical protein